MFKSRLIMYKSYKAREYSFSVDNGSEPAILTFKVFNTKKPKAEISLTTCVFSESRGIGTSSTRKLTITCPNSVIAIKAAIDDQAHLGAAIDYLCENSAGVPEEGAVSKKKLTRWWYLAMQENPQQTLHNEWREKLHNDKKFSIGERVVFTGGYRNPQAPLEVTIIGERFDFNPYSLANQGWKYSFANYQGIPQNNFRKLKTAEVATVAS